MVEENEGERELGRRAEREGSAGARCSYPPEHRAAAVGGGATVSERVELSVATRRRYREEDDEAFADNPLAPFSFFWFKLAPAA